MALREAVLPNGDSVFCQNPITAREIYGQVKLYFLHGIELHPGATVVDVGANIGLFTLMADELCHQDVRVFAFEPMPATYAVLSANLARVSSTRLHAVNCGVSDHAGRAVFSFHPNMTTLSTVYPDEQHELRGQLKASILRNIDATGAQIRWIRWLPAFVRSRILDKALNDMFAVTLVECELRTISDIIRENDLDRIDLLKVDAEKSEMDVLSGIDAADWPRIHQVVTEVHDLEDRLQRVTDLLTVNGLNVVKVEQEPALAGSNVHTVYARRETRLTETR